MSTRDKLIECSLATGICAPVLMLCGCCLEGVCMVASILIALGLCAVSFICASIYQKRYGK